MLRRAVLALVALLAVAAPVASAQPAPGRSAPASAPGDRVLGRDDAPVTVIAYASVTCPHCAEWHARHLPELQARYIDTGQVRFVYREFLTAPGPLSAAGVLVARCAAPERYFDVIDALMRQQALIQQPGGASAWIAAGAAAGALDPAAVEACLSDPAALEALEGRMAQAREAGVRGTPSFFIDGAPFDGYEFESFDAVLRRRAAN